MTAEEAKQRIAARDAAKQAAAETEIEKKKAELATMQSRVQEQLPTYLSYAYSAIAKAIDCGVDIERDGVSFGCGCDEEGDYIAAQLSEALRKDDPSLASLVGDGRPHLARWDGDGTRGSPTAWR